MVRPQAAKQADNSSCAQQESGRPHLHDTPDVELFTAQRFKTCLQANKFQAPTLALASGSLFIRAQCAKPAGRHRTKARQAYNNQLRATTAIGLPHGPNSQMHAV